MQEKLRQTLSVSGGFKSNLREICLWVFKHYQSLHTLYLLITIYVTTKRKYTNSILSYLIILPTSSLLLALSTKGLKGQDQLMLYKSYLLVTINVCQFAYVYIKYLRPIIICTMCLFQLLHWLQFTPIPFESIRVCWTMIILLKCSHSYEGLRSKWNSYALLQALCSLNSKSCMYSNPWSIRCSTYNYILMLLKAFDAYVVERTPTQISNPALNATNLLIYRNEALRP